MGQELDSIDFTVEELQDLAKRCVDFTEMFCGRTFYPYQREFAIAINKSVLAGLSNQTLTGLFARQSGKSETVANTAAALMVLLPKLASLKDENGAFLYPPLRKFADGLFVGIFAPSAFQSGTTYGRLRERFTKPSSRLFLDSPEFAPEGLDSLLPILPNKNDHLGLPNGSFCLMMSADKQSKIESKTFHMILLDEAQDLDEFVVGKSVMPMGAHTNATSIATGTPGVTKGFFYRRIEQNKTYELDRRRPERRHLPKLHFQYDYKTVIKYQPEYSKFIRGQKRDLGEESDEFQMAYCLKWLLERGMAVTEDLFDELTKPNLRTYASMKNEELVAGLDWGKGADSTVLTIGKPLWEEADAAGKCPVEIVHWWEKVGDDYEMIFAGLKAELDNFSVHSLAADATGVGEPLADRLTYELPFVTVIPVKFSAQAKDHLYKFFLLMLQEKKVMWPGDPNTKARKYFKNFRHQMLNLQKEYKGQYLACHAPEDQRNAHDDFPDSLALMLWNINEQAMPFVEMGQEHWYQGHNWWKEPKGQFSLHQKVGYR